MDLYLLKFNNYYNRIVKKFDTLAEYLSAPYYNGDVVENLAFDPNDNVNTYQIVNTNYSCDYAVLADGNTIVSRWFVIETKRLRNRQWQLQLRRDLIVVTAQYASSPSAIELKLPSMLLNPEAFMSLFNVPKF